jgi:hypothetical protein
MAGRGGDNLDSADALDQGQHQAIIALINEPTIKKAADACGVGERTLYTWLGQEAFSREYRKARRVAFAQAISMTQKYTPMAVQTLAKVTADATAPHAAKVSAATALLKFSRESIELDEVVGRLTALERDAEERKNKETH